MTGGSSNEKTIFEHIAYRLYGDSAHAADTNYGNVLCVFNEQYNGDKNTDYASNLIDVSFVYSVKFNANGGEDMMDLQTMTFGIKEELPANTFTKPGYTFNGWNTKVDGTGTSYSDEQSVTNLESNASDSPVALYAGWEAKNYTVTFDTTGGTAVNTKTNVKWMDKVLAGVPDPRRTGYEFTGWKYGDVDVKSDDTYAKSSWLIPLSRN